MYSLTRLTRTAVSLITLLTSYENRRARVEPTQEGKGETVEEAAERASVDGADVDRVVGVAAGRILEVAPILVERIEGVDV